MASFNNTTREGGFLLVDVLVGLFIASILTTAFISSVVVAVRHAQVQSKAMQAELLVLEMVEVTRALEKSAAGWSELTSGKCDTACHPEVSNTTEWELLENSEDVGVFTRSMTISDVCRNDLDEIISACDPVDADDHSKRVVASVLWQTYGKSASTSLETYVYDYN